MSSTEETTLKAGHPPAVKAGGMRITQHKPAKENKTEKDVNAEEGDEHINSLMASSSPPKTTMVSGAPVRGNADFPTEAVQHFHNKPVPTHDARPTHDKPNFIQQPRK